MNQHIARPILHKKVEVPPRLLSATEADGRQFAFGGDVRIGDLQGKGRADFLVYRSVDDAHDGGGMKPSFLGAFTIDGEVLWAAGEGGEQPCRPGPVAIYDIDGDGSAEVVCLFHDPTVGAPPTSMADVVLQIRDGKTGEVKRRAAPPELTACSGRGPNWAHQRILVANFRGNPTPRDFVIKLGSRIIAFDENLEALWTYDVRWNEYGECSAYIPSVGDINGDGRDEVNGGYFLLAHDGTPLWEEQLGNHMDSVAITEWDDGRARAICSGYGHVMDDRGNVILRLGEGMVPHGQEVRVGRFIEGDTLPQMIIRYNGHSPDVMVVDTTGEVLKRLRLNSSPNETGMEIVEWDGPGRAHVLYNGGMLWRPMEGTSVALPDLPKPTGGRMGWYHCIPADVCGDEREELVLYNPWVPAIYIYTPEPLTEAAYAGYHPGPRQYNARLMD